MADYIARVSIEYSFAEEKMKELGGFWYSIEAMLGKECAAKMSVNRFTFATFVMEAESPEKCRELIKKTWSLVFGDREAISEILVSEYAGKEDDRSKLIRSIFENYYGVDDYCRLAADILLSIPVLRKKEALDVFRQTNFVFAVDPGCGFTTLISSLADDLRRMGVYPEEENDKRTKYVEFCLGKETANGFADADTVIDYLKLDEDEENVYGLVGLDITYYLEKNRHEELRTFLKRLEKYRGDYMFAFRIPFMEKKALDEILALLSDLMIIKTIQIPPYHDCVLMEVFWNMLNNKSFNPDISLIELAGNKIRQEKIDGRFYGFKTVEKIAREIMLKKALLLGEEDTAGNGWNDARLVAEDLAGYVDTHALEAKGYEALSEMIGMEKITEKIKEIVAQVRVAISEESLDRPCIHMRFTGAPGTGKTTVARILGQIMKEEGILRKGAFLEYTGRDLCAEYVGQTAVKTAAICRDSYGSVLFIDEAYSLYDYDDKNNDFGREALATLVSEMENHRDDMLVIMAGYTDEMDHLMKGNPGLRSRMPYVIHFPNYSREQLFQIFMLMVKKHFRFRSEFEEEAKNYFMSLSDEMLDSKEFANARFVRNLYERVWSKGALRASLSGSRKVELWREDFVSASSEKEFSEKLAGKKKIGF